LELSLESRNLRALHSRLLHSSATAAKPTEENDEKKKKREKKKRGMPPTGDVEPISQASGKQKASRRP
jgi:hypothetical protein